MRDIGHHLEPVRPLDDISGSSMSTDQQLVLSQMREVIGPKQVSASKLSFAPAWILLHAYDSEIDDNWKGAYEVVDESSIPEIRTSSDVTPYIR